MELQPEMTFTAEFRITPRFETGDARDAWLNTALFIGRGRMTRNGVQYEIYLVT